MNDDDKIRNITDRVDQKIEKNYCHGLLELPAEMIHSTMTGILSRYINRSFHQLALQQKLDRNKS